MTKTPAWLVWLSHIIVPIVFFFLAYLSIWTCFEISWQLIATLSIACLPFILILLARYIKKLKIGNHEYESPETENISKEDVIKLEKKTPTPEVEVSTYGELSREAKKVLRTLWIYQRQHFGAEDTRRWGFCVRPPAPDYSQFRIGATQLLQMGLTVESDKGMVFLNDKGMEFCKNNKNGIDGGGDIWTQFTGE
jgi:hypothetical protein